MLPKLSLYMQAKEVPCQNIGLGLENGVASCCNPAQLLSGGLFPDPITHCDDVLFHLAWAGQTVDMDLCSLS